ncbi:MAG: DNA-directed RNA polymerase subunit K [Candidatus Bathyarchaeia archaeon]
MPKKAQASTRQINPIPIGPPKLTRFERARIVGARALQIAMGAPTILDIPQAKSPIDIAVAELEEGVLPMSIRRKLPDGCYENIALESLINRK